MIAIKRVKAESWHLYAIATMLLWSHSNATNRMVRDVFTPYQLGALRFFFASIVMLFFVLHKKLPPPQKKDVPFFLFSSGCGMVLRYIFSTASLRFLSAAPSVVFSNMTPIITLFLAAVLYKIKIPKLAWRAVLIELCGIFVIALGSQGEQKESLFIGMILSLLSATCMAIYNVAQRKNTNNYHPLQVTAYSIFISMLFTLPFLPDAVENFPKATTFQLVSVVIQGVGSAAIGNVLWVKAISMQKNTGTVSNYQFLNPVLSAVFAFFMIGEVPDLMTAIGCVIILLGLIIFQTASRR